ncbi:GTP 3',8-cyclase MoaA [Neomicrococcus aestuarii]|uniref:GTP 3',8-cyclase n=1 Tax=Neomicrococcus aestuarii TaxID=556325 RepID=A0A1L2ZMS0_9MICC|nr:GTP 3',8-cyclase MoaA [Neomicrococcus aestuarii]APF40328.1 cyclic pyranopterin phosphate synthase [Neomicrococcus aestuarii]
MTVHLGLPTIAATGASCASGSAEAAPGQSSSNGVLPHAEHHESALLDRYGRRATDLRISLIDKCNLRCTYCMPADGLPWLAKEQLLSLEEITRIVRVGVRTLGIRELRLTGGEPLVRKDLVDIIAAIRAEHPDLPISMTTNGVGLDKKAQALKDAGLTRINVSLDTLHAEVFEKLTRRDHFPRVMAGIDAALTAGLTPVKINAVLMRGVNDHEAADLLHWALERGLELRFIEHMPLDADKKWVRDGLVTASEIREQIREDFTLEVSPENRNGAPAERFLVKDASGSTLGTVGIIASVTEPFCADCTRTRITAEGKVMSCLFSSEETDLRGLLRDGSDDDALAQRWKDAMWLKPRAHGADEGIARDEFVRPERSMSAIGG